MSERDGTPGGFSKIFSDIGLLKKIPAGVTAVSGFIGAVVGLVKVVQGEADLIVNILVYCGPVLLWFSCFYIYFLKRKPKTPTGFGRPSPPGELYVFSPAVRRGAYHGIYLVPVLTLIGASVGLYLRYKRPDKVIIAVAEFKNLDQSNAGAFEKIMEKLREATKNYESQIKVVPLGKTISDQEGGNDAAREAGESKKSSIVIWGWSSKDFITAYFVPLLRNRSHIAQSGGGPVLSLEVGEGRPFRVQVKQLSEGVAYLALLTVGLAHYEAQDFAGAVQLLNDAISHAKALASADDELNKNIDLAKAYFYLGRALADQVNYDQAIVNYNEALRLNPNLEDAYLYMGYSQHYVGDKNGAKDSFSKAIARYTDIIRKDPGDVSAYLGRSSAYSNRGESGDLENALVDCDAALRLEPQSAPARNNRGSVLYKKGEVDAAITEFNEAIRLDPHDSSAYNNRATAYSKKGEYEKALADYKRVIEYRPADSSSYLNRAFVHVDQNHYQSAIADYNEAIRLNPSNFRAYRNRGWANMFLGLYGDAARDATKFLELRTQCNDDFVYVTLLGYYSYRRSNSPDAAEALLNSVTADCEGLGWPYSLIKFLHRQIDAQQLLKEAGQDKDQLTEAHTYIGMSLSLSGQTGEAAEHFKWVKENGNTEFDEYRLALAEENRLEPTSGG